MKYYSVHKGIKPGIYNNWNDCKNQIYKFPGAKYKSFTNHNDAKYFLENGTIKAKNPIQTIDNFIEIKSTNKNNINHIVYTDGGCYGNGKEISYGGYGIYFNENDPRNYSGPIIGKCSNNIAELNAILKVFDILEKEINNNENILIVTDSDYSIKCFTTYGDKCNSIFWKKNIPNKELIKKGYFFIKKFHNIKFKHIHSHTGNNDIYSLGNECADKLATKAIILSISKNSNEYISKTNFLSGKYKSKTIEYVYNNDPNYIHWFIRNKPNKKDKIFPMILKQYIKNINNK